MNATYVISIARKLGCSIFLLPEDIIEVLVNKINRRNTIVKDLVLMCVHIYMNR